MIGLGLGEGQKQPSGEVRVGFRRGWVRSIAVTVGGAGAIGLAVGILDLAEKQPGQAFELLQKWGFAWLLALAGMLLVWDLIKVGLRYLEKLADSVQQSAVAMNRIADKDDRERDRMTTEISYVGQRMERLTREHQDARDEQRGNHREIVTMLSKLSVAAEKSKGEQG